MDHHRTLHECLYGYLDRLETVGSKIICRGWVIAYPLVASVPLALVTGDSREPLELELYARDDVAVAYGKIDESLLCGFECSFSAKVASAEIRARMDDGWVSVLTLVAQKPVDVFSVTAANIPTVVIIDNFYEQPLAVRDFALKQTFVEENKYYRGCRSDQTFRPEQVRLSFERALQRAIVNWDSYAANGVFQYCKAGDQLVYHVDLQMYAAVVFLTPDAPVQCGTTLFQTKASKARILDTPDACEEAFSKGYYDKTSLEQVDVIGNVFNRAIIFNAHNIHAASEYFGTDMHNSRLFHMFFFDVNV